MTTAVAATQRARERHYLVRYAGPAILALAVLVVGPLSYALWISLQRYSFAAPEPTFAGLDNYLGLLTDAAFGRSLVATAAVVVPALVLQMGLGLGWAIAIHSLRRGRALVTTIMALPVMVSGASVGMAFRTVLTPEWGPADQVVRAVSDVRLDWLGDPALSRVAVVVADVWQNTPFVMLVSLAAIAAVPREVDEAADVDGAGRWQRFRYVTFPLIRKFLLIALLFRLIDLFRIFDVIFTMTGGGPAGATETLSFFIYQQGIQFFNIGYAASAGLCLALATVLFSRALIHNVETRRR